MSTKHEHEHPNPHKSGRHHHHDHDHPHPKGETGHHHPIGVVVPEPPSTTAFWPSFAEGY